ncbi:hypothetical protein LOTGIDRAFT_235180 [Lottia gigantea]|uniref:Uncharacterized protein n=1 Tax=Lottia gigantea TaxID=225164 RepID=V3ZQW4_LOTGI|nr:hypothetical protein LOTGIDRAFT_235180 [Lottia gigantea]ESO86747.1 hypothetical protein LOTGIDRAFT_235180 [Lottia gigantea]
MDRLDGWVTLSDIGAMDRLDGWVTLSDIGADDDEGHVGKGAENKQNSWLEVAKCDNDSCQNDYRQTPDENVRAENRPDAWYEPSVNRQNSPEDNKQNFRPPERNCINDIKGINGVTQNIPVSVPPNNTENTGSKLVKHCFQETLDYLNDQLLLCYDKNWKCIASRHGWTFERISQFHYKHRGSEFKELMLTADFCNYTVKELLGDLKDLKRIDLLNNYPVKWN